MIRPTQIFRTAGTVALLFLIGTAHATTIYQMAGTVTVVGSNLGSDVQVGDSFQVDFSFDESVAAWNTSATQKLYNLQSSVLTIQATGGDLTWERQDPAGNNFSHGFAVEKSASQDKLTLNTGAFPKMTGPNLNGKAIDGGLVFTFTDTSKTAFSSTDYPTSLNPSWFSSQLLDLRFTGGIPHQDIINFNVSSMTVNPSAVPEPSTYTLLAGLVVLGLTFTRRRRRS